MTKNNQPTDPLPKPYADGWIEFYKLKFKLTQEVLIPRPETELLVDAVIKYANELPADKTLSMIDIGTGSGNIAISVAKNVPKAKIIATEISAEALAIAKLNAKFHGVSDQIEFIVSDLFAQIDQTDFDVIVTNLPYIPVERIAYLDSSVKDYEPFVALDGGQDGFELYRQTFNQINQKGIKFKLFLGEIDYTHGEIAALESKKSFPDSEVELRFDLFHRQRILVIKH